MIVIYDHPNGRLPFYLVSPSGETISGAALPPGFAVRYRSTPTARFAEVKFPKGEPERYATTPTRRWQVIIAHEGRVCFGDINPQRDEKYDEYKGVRNSEEIGAGFLPRKCKETKDPIDYGIAIGAGSNLRMQAFVEPGVKYVGDSIRLNGVIAEAGLPVKHANVTVIVENPSGATSTVVLRDDGAHQDGEADDGDYGGMFINTSQAGVYRFLFRAEGTHSGLPFVRETQRGKTVYDRRKPPDVGKPDGEDCCRRLVAALSKVKKKAD